MRAEKVYHLPLKKAENVKFMWNSTVEKLLYENKLNGVSLKNNITDKFEDLSLDGLFISIGRSPATELFKGQLKLDQNGYIVAGEDTKTSIDGVYAVGDVRTKPFRQIVTAVADGAVAAHFAEEYLASK